MPKKIAQAGITICGFVDKFRWLAGSMLLLSGCARPGNNDAAEGTSSTSTAGGGTTSTSQAAEADDGCSGGEESTLTLHLPPGTGAMFVVDVRAWQLSTVTCPAGTVDGEPVGVVCGIDFVEIERIYEVFPTSVRVSLNGGPEQLLEATCTNTSSCPKVESNACEVWVENVESTSDSQGGSEGTAGTT